MTDRGARQQVVIFFFFSALFTTISPEILVKPQTFKAERKRKGILQLGIIRTASFGMYV